MAIKFTCPNGHRLAAKESRAGTTANCPACGAKVEIPSVQAVGCSESSILRILGIGEELRKTDIPPGAMPPDPQDFVLGRAKTAAPTPKTQICPQCDWEIDSGYRICPHCRCYLMGKVSEY